MSRDLQKCRERDKEIQRKKKKMETQRGTKLEINKLYIYGEKFKKLKVIDKKRHKD